MPKYYFKVAKGSEGIEINPYEIEEGQKLEIPPKVTDLVTAFLNTDEVLRMYFLDIKKANSEYNLYLDELAGLGQLGITGENSFPDLAKQGLDLFKRKIVNREAGILKNQYLTNLGVKALYFAIIPLLLGLLFDFLKCNDILTLEYCQTCLVSGNLLFVWAGTMLGVWLSFAISRVNIVFEDLGILEKDLLSPKIRLLFTGALAIAFGLLFISHSIVIKFGNLSTEDVKDYSIAAFLVGIILGVNEKILGKTLVDRTAGLT